MPPAVERALQRELHELHLAQERYRATHGKYAETLFDLRFTPSSGVVVRLHEATERGFSATAGRASYECALFVGDVSSPCAYARDPTVIACEAGGIGAALPRGRAPARSEAGVHHVLTTARVSRFLEPGFDPLPVPPERPVPAVCQSQSVVTSTPRRPGWRRRGRSGSARRGDPASGAGAGSRHRLTGPVQSPPRASAPKATGSHIRT